MTDWRSLAMDVLRGGVEGATTGALGGPVDLTTMVMRPLGYDVEKPVGGSEWWRDRFQSLGMYKPRSGTTAEKVGEIAGSFAAPGPDPMQWASLAMMGPAMMGAIKAYHGSPHTFDKFDMSKIGTGEGAQAFGHGLYFADNPQTAEHYRASVTPFQDMKKNIDDPIAQAKYFANTWGGREGGMSWFRSVINSAKKNPKNHLPGDIERAQASLDYLANGGDITTQGGNIYHVNLDVEPEDLLDWDGPLSHQSEKVRAATEANRPALERHWREVTAGDEDIAGDPWRTMTGADLYQQITRGADPAAAAQRLREAGIKGIRYLDGGSRASGEGTSNYVLFDDALAQILERNGVPVTR